MKPTIGDMELTTNTGAIFTANKERRYLLWRVWDRSKPFVMFIGLNPSTADETKNDPTIRRVVSFAAKWGFGGVIMANLFSIVTPYPADLAESPDPVGRNDDYLLAYGKECAEIVFCWGAFKEAKERGATVAAMFPCAKALLLNSDGTPRHPFYVLAVMAYDPMPFVIL